MGVKNKTKLSNHDVIWGAEDIRYKIKIKHVLKGKIMVDLVTESSENQVLKIRTMN